MAPSGRRRDRDLRRALLPAGPAEGVLQGTKPVRGKWGASAGPGRPALDPHSPGRPDSVAPVLTVIPDHVMSFSMRPGVRPSVAGAHVTPTGGLAGGEQRRAWLGRGRRPRAGPGGWRAGHSPGLQSEQRHRSLLRHGPRWPALATGSGVQCPASLPPARSSPPLSAPGSPPHEFSLTLPRPPRLIWFSPVPLAPLDAVLSVMPAPGAARCGRGVARDPAPSPHGRRAAVPRGGGASSGWARAASLLPESLSPGPEAAAASRWCPAAGLPAHCAFGLALLPSRLRAGPGGPAGAAPEPSAK